MKKINYVTVWLDTVAASYSGSQKTRETYASQFNAFLGFIEASAEEILEDYNTMTEKAFRRKYATMLKAWLSALHNESYSPYTVAGHIRTVKSFFKYNDLPLGFIPSTRRKVLYHNRDMERKEIQQIIRASRPRERAFYTMMAQTGLRPSTLCSLQKQHLEPDFTAKTIPCCIKIPEKLAKGKFGSHFTFMGEEAVEALRGYFATRTQEMKEDSPVFSMYGKHEGQPCDRQTFTNIFRQKLNALKKKGLIDFKRLQIGKPAELRLYNLRKFFRKYAGQAGVEYVNFWMGHKTNYKAPYIPASDEYYFNREDVEFHRKIYAEKAMPFLRIEEPTPTETDKVIRVQQKKIEELEGQLQTVKPLAEAVATMSPEDLKALIEFIKKPKGLLLKTPDEEE